MMAAKIVVLLLLCLVAASDSSSFSSASSSAAAAATKAVSLSSSIPPPGEVVELTDDNFDAVISADSHTDWMVAVVAPWCSHCRQLEPTWRSLAKRLAAEGGGGDTAAARKKQQQQRRRRQGGGFDDDDAAGDGEDFYDGEEEDYDDDDPEAGVTIRVATIDSTKQRILTHRFGVRAFPSIYFLRAGETFDYGNRPRTEEALFAFATGGWADLEPSPPWRAPNSLAGRAIGALLAFPRTLSASYRRYHVERGWPALAVVAVGLAGPVAVGLGSIAALDAFVTSRARASAAAERRRRRSAAAAAAAVAGAGAGAQTAAATPGGANNDAARPHAD